MPTRRGTERWQKGTIGTFLDHQRGGLVCLQHVLDDVAEAITLYLKRAPS
jgi:hypothetical protein